MHDHGIVHRDIKMDNILMTSDRRPIICDFGISISHEESAGGSASTGSTRDDRTGATNPAGTQGYIAPEVLMGKRATFSADMFAVGVLLCKAYLGCEPTADCVVPDVYPGEPIQQLIEGCLKINPLERLTANEVLASPFFKVTTGSSNKQLDGDEKIELLRRQTRLLRKSNGAAFALHVRRGAIVQDTVEAFGSMDATMISQSGFAVHFIGEPAVGAGAGSSRPLVLSLIHVCLLFCST